MRAKIGNIIVNSKYYCRYFSFFGYKRVSPIKKGCPKGQPFLMG